MNCFGCFWGNEMRSKLLSDVFFRCDNDKYIFIKILEICVGDKLVDAKNRIASERFVGRMSRKYINMWI